MTIIETRYGNLHYNIQGTGEPVVLIRGLGRWSAHWCGWDQLLSKHMTVITFDSRGLGQTTIPIRPWNTVRDLGDDISAILKQEQIERAHLVGTSLGGQIALEFAITYPDMTKSITPIAASVGRSGHSRISSAAIRLLLTSAHKPHKFYPELARLLTSPHSPEKVRKELATEWMTIDKAYAQPQIAVINQLVAALRFRHWERLNTIRCPVHIIAGNDDLFVPRGNSLYLHQKIPESLLSLVDKAGHEPHVDQPSVMTQLVTDFISEHS
jgi:pimeloyl-ACP methyl ester carboxylesterase